MVPKTGFDNCHDWITAVIGLYAVTQCVGWGKGSEHFSFELVEPHKCRCWESYNSGGSVTYRNDF